MALVETDKGSSARTVVGFMIPATAIALIGHVTQETKYLSSPSTTKKPTLAPGIGDAQIILGGTIAIVILTLIGQMGPIGGTFAKGISVLALITSVGLYGTPVVDGINNVLGKGVPHLESVQSTPPAKKAPTKGTK